MHCVAAWRRLHGDRAVWGQGLGPIPSSAFDAWATRQGLDSEALDLIFHALAVADGERSKREQYRRELENMGGPKR